MDLIRTAGKPEVQAIVERFLGNKNSFAANFSIEPVAPTEVEFDLRALERVFTAVTYGAL